MKRLLSLILCIIMVVSTMAVALTSYSAAETFVEGDILYLDVSSFTDWIPDGTTLYANFSNATKPVSGQVDIETADKSQYSPRAGLASEGNNLFSYTVTKEDAGKSVMRFWRGNETTLWNYSITITPSDLASGNNTVKVTGKNGEGELTYTDSYKYKLNPTISVSKSKAEIGEPIDITLDCSKPADDVTLDYELYVNDEKVADSNTYTYTLENQGSTSITGVVTAKDDSNNIQGLARVNTTVSTASASITILKANQIYVHGTTGKETDSESWLKWQDYNNKKYFYLPTSLKSGSTLEFYNSYSSNATLKVGTTTATLAPGAITKAIVSASTGTLVVGNTTYNCVFDFSSAEGAVFVNNVDTTQTDGKDLWEYLISNKANYAACTAAVTLKDGSIILQDVKKMKGRGNTSWNNTGNPKYGWNLTFSKAIKLGTMQNCKKFSLISNFQDASLNRNRFLYDLADEINMTYASDSRFIDFYVNGVYRGAYMMAQKVDTGKDTLMDDINEDEYLDYIAGTQTDFPVVIELGYPDDGDASIRAKDGNTITLKNPGLSSSDPNAEKVLSYIRSKYNVMSSALSNNTTNLSDYLDLESMAQMYLLNEFGKNWDSGSSSVFYVWKPDENGKYRFYASPVWDYDNSLGNPRGSDDYMLPTGWWAKSKNGSSNTYKMAANNKQVQNVMYQVWFEQFIPAIAKFTDSKNISTGELWSQDVYYNLLKDQATMNYDVSPMIVDSSWIGNHSSLQTYGATYSYDSKGYVNKVNLTTGSKNTYDQYSFKGEYDYMVDWARSRAAWMSSQYIDSYNQIEHPDKPTEPTEPSTEPATEEPDPVVDTSNSLAVWEFNSKDKVSGEKLTEYGSSDGYAATKGTGTLKLSVDGTKLRALEWSAVEYGTSGTKMVPIMSAGTNNVWYANGTPYIEVSNINTTGYEKLKFTAYLAGSKKAPANWKLQYSVDGTNYTDISGATVSITLENRKVLTAYLDKTSIPETAAGKNNVSFRLIPINKTTIAGGNVDDATTSGEIAINYIVVQGAKTGTSTLRGDVDCNGKVDIIDTTSVQQYLARQIELSDQGIINGSIDVKNQFSIEVATRIQQYLAKLRSTL